MVWLLDPNQLRATPPGYGQLRIYIYIIYIYYILYIILYIYVKSPSFIVPRRRRRPAGELQGVISPQDRAAIARVLVLVSYRSPAKSDMLSEINDDKCTLW